MKKIFTILAALLLLFQNAIAQERLWGIASGAIFSVNKDGTDYTSTQLLGGGIGNSVLGYAKTPNGIVYVTYDDESEEGDVGVLNQEGTHYFYHHQYLGPRGSEGMVYAADGKIYMPGRSVMSGKMTGIRITDPQGSFYTSQGFTNTSFLSDEVYLTATSEGTFGVSKGTTGNYGGIFKLSSDAKSIQIIYQFTASSPGTRAIGKLVVGTDGTLFGETLRGGKDDKGIYFKLNKDGSNFLKIGDKADGAINASNAQGKYQRLVDFIALGYSPLRDSEGFIFLSTSDGVYKISDDGTPLLKVISWPGESLSFISSPIAHDVKVNNLTSGSTHVPVNLTLTLDAFEGVDLYEIQVSTSPDFSSDVQFQRHRVPSFNFSLAGNTTYYVRARPMEWPYFGAVTTFKTQISFDVSEERLWGVRATSTVGTVATNEKVIFSMKKDGTDYIEHQSHAGGFKQLQDGAVLTTDVAGNETHVMKKITKDGSNFMYEMSSYGGNTEGYTVGVSMIEIGDGKLMGTNARFGDKVRGTVLFAEDGSLYDSKGFLNNANLSPDFYLAKTDNGIYGLSRGDSNNKGFVFRVRDNRLGFDIVYQFQGLEDGKQPFGKIQRGADGFLYAQTIRGGKNNAGIVFKVKDDGTSFTKLLDRADGDIHVRATDGRFFRLLDFVRAGYPGIISDSDGFYYVVAPSGIWKVRPDGYPEAQLSSLNLVQEIAFISPAFKSGTFVSNIDEGAQGLPKNLTLTTDSFPGASKYYFELSKSPDFNPVIISLSSPSPHVGVQGLEAVTKYYSRVRPNVWPYFDKVVSFTTGGDLSEETSHVMIDDFTNITYVNREGTDRMVMKSILGNDENYSGADLIQLSNREILVSSDFKLYKLNAQGLTPLYDFNYDEHYWARTSWVEGKDGYLYFLNYSVIGPEATAITRLKLDGTARESVGLPMSDVHGYQPKLTATASGIYGINPGVGGDPGYIFKLNNDMSGVQIIHNFVQGSKPQGRLLNGDDGYFYGVTRSGGDNNGGIIYRIKTDGTGFTVLYHFNTTTGRGPVVGLVSDDEGNLYGATRIGGLSGKGVIFKVHRDGSGYQVLLNMANAGGQYPEVAIDIDEFSNIYGVAEGIGFFKMESGSNQVTSLRSYFLPEDVRIFRPFVPEVSVVNPADQSSIVGLGGTFTVSAITGATRYYLEVSESPLFGGSPLIFESDTTLIQVGGLNPLTSYFARVRTGLCPFYGTVTSFTTGKASSPTEIISEQARMNMDDSATGQTLQVYPNPTEHAFNVVALEPNEIVSVVVTNSSGLMVYENKSVSADIQFGADLPRGIYFLKLRTKRGVETSRLVKQ